MEARPGGRGEQCGKRFFVGEPVPAGPGSTLDSNCNAEHFEKPTTGALLGSVSNPYRDSWLKWENQGASNGLNLTVPPTLLESLTSLS